jgi:hypothetical protein
LGDLIRGISVARAVVTRKIATDGRILCLYYRRIWQVTVIENATALGNIQRIKHKDEKFETAFDYFQIQELPYHKEVSVIIKVL